MQDKKTGCNTYHKLEMFRNATKENITLEKHQPYMLCSNQSMIIKQTQFNDLIPDCELEADEPILYSLLINEIITSPGLLPEGFRSCHEGHPLLFSKNDMCIYEVDLNGILQTCRNGKHLENSSDFNCGKIDQFKCPGYYCI